MMKTDTLRKMSKQIKRKEVKIIDFDLQLLSNC